MEEDLILTLAYQKDLLIKKALIRHKGNSSKAAKDLGVTARMVHYSKARFEIENQENEKVKETKVGISRKNSENL